MARICDRPGCDNPHQARGLCNAHYHKAYPHKVRYETVTCVVCGQQRQRRWDGPKRSAKYLPTCSYQCRRIVEHGWRTPLPDDHPARWYGHAQPVAYTHCKFCHTLFVHDGRQARVYCSAHSVHSRPRFVAASCHDCGKPFMLDRQAYQSTSGCDYGYCSTACRGRASRRRRRAREFDAAGEFRWVDMIGLWIALDRRCAYCGIQSDQQPDPDHVLPLSRGGDNTIANVLPACRRCNCQKGSLTLAEWAERRQERGHPPLPHPWRSMGWRRVEQAPGGTRLDAA